MQVRLQQSSLTWHKYDATSHFLGPFRSLKLKKRNLFIIFYFVYIAHSPNAFLEQNKKETTERNERLFSINPIPTSIVGCRQGSIAIPAKKSLQLELITNRILFE